MQRQIDERTRTQRVARTAQPELRPALDEGYLADHACEPVVPDLAADALGFEQIAQMRDLDQRGGGVDHAHGSGLRRSYFRD